MKCGFSNAIKKGIELFSNSYLVETAESKQKRNVIEEMTPELLFTIIMICLFV